MIDLKLITKNEQFNHGAMKKLMLLLPIVFSFHLSFAQENEFAPLGAEWYFDEQLLVPYVNHGYNHYQVIKDTLINGKAAKLIIKQEVYPTGILAGTDSLYTYEEDSKVYFLINHQFELIYDFGAKVGDTIKFSSAFYPCDSVAPVVVDSIEIITVNGVSLKRQFLSNELVQSGYENEKIIDVVTEKLGHNRGIFYYPHCEPIDYFVEPFLRCYQDSLISYVEEYWNYLYPGSPCDTTIFLGIKNERTDGQVKIFPNPVKSSVTIEGLNHISCFEVLDTRGQKLLSTTGVNLNCLDVSCLPAGLYVLKIITSRSESYSSLFIKN